MPNPIAIITFHHFHPLGGKLSVPPEVMEAVLSKLKQRYTFISYDQFKGYLSGTQEAPRRCVLVTIDDGYLDNFIHGFPVFRQLDIPIVIFLVTGLIQDQSICRRGMEYIDHREIWRKNDRTCFLNTAELHEMKQSGLVSFGSHSLSHMAFEDQTRAQMENELHRSHAFLADLDLERPPYGFCWPRGRFDATALEIIRQSPYGFAFSTRDGGFCKRDDPFTIRRIDCSSFSGDRRDYSARLKRKLWIYSSRTFGHWYSAFKVYRQSCFKSRR